VLLSIQGGSDLGLFEINEAAQLVANSAAPEANIIFGAVIDDALGDEVRVTVIAAGFDEAGARRVLPAQAVLARPALDSGGAGGAASFPGSGGFSTGNGHPAGAHARDSAAAERVAEGRVAAEPAASLTTSPDATAPTAEAEQAAGPAGSRAEDATWSAAPENAASPDSGDHAAGPVPAATAAVPARHRADPSAAARMFDAATTRRRSVVFEEDDELDVPDFLK
jgi:cell division protein FtsZ